MIEKSFSHIPPPESFEELGSVKSVERNQNATFLGRSASSSYSAQSLLPHPSQANDEFTSRQKDFADFGMPTDLDVFSFERTGESEDLFEVSTAYQPVNFKDDAELSPLGSLGLFDDIREVETEELNGDIPEQSHQTKAQPNPEGEVVIEVVLEWECSGTDSDEQLNQQYAPAPISEKFDCKPIPSVINHPVTEHSHHSLHEPKGLFRKNRQPESTDAKPSPIRIASSQFAPRAEKSARQVSANSPSDITKDQTEAWIIRTGSKERPFQCGYQDCGKLYKRLDHLRGHFIAHTRTSKYKCPYPNCRFKKCFVSGSNLERHIRSCHLKTTSCLCKVCGGHFARKDTLKTHMLKIHQVSQPYDLELEGFLYEVMAHDLDS